MTTLFSVLRLLCAFLSGYGVARMARNKHHARSKRQNGWLWHDPRVSDLVGQGKLLTVKFSNGKEASLSEVRSDD